MKKKIVYIALITCLSLSSCKVKPCPSYGESKQGLTRKQKKKMRQREEGLFRSK